MQFQPSVGKQQNQPENHQKQTPPQLSSASAKQTQVVPGTKKQLLAPKVCPRNPSYVLFLGFVTWPDAPGAVFLAHFYIK